MKKILLAIILMAPTYLFAFCGFYVAQSNTKLFNKASEVIIVRDGNKTVLTMSNDFKGNAKDFAMVIPVPVVIKESQIKIADQRIFEVFNSYSMPRLSEYYDENPCQPKPRYCAVAESATDAFAPRMHIEKKMNKDKVTIEASYTVGEYDILVLSAQESNGLKTWLTVNGYKIPEGAEEVLEPYIKSNTKFFVAKVNIKKMQQGQFTNLRPLQISFESPKYMLPIRLGMANAQDVQDLIIYAFTKKGAVECTNYRTVNMPTEIDMPLSVRNNFTNLYRDIFSKAYRREGKNVVFKEYAWDLSGTNYMHCDPCTGTIPNGQDLTKAGVWWLDIDKNNYSSAGYSAPLFITRLHVRYDRKHFPQDLQFQNTPSQENFQVKYNLHHPATGDMQCEGARAYLESVKEREQLEQYNLFRYAGWTTQQKLGSSFPAVEGRYYGGLSKIGIAFLSIFVGIIIVKVFFMKQQKA
jgi:hypothetical protein